MGETVASFQRWHHCLGCLFNAVCILFAFFLNRLLAIPRTGCPGLGGRGVPCGGSGGVRPRRGPAEGPLATASRDDAMREEKGGKPPSAPLAPLMSVGPGPGSAKHAEEPFLRGGGGNSDERAEASGARGGATK